MEERPRSRMYLARAGHFANSCANPVDLREHLIVKTKPSELFFSGNFLSKRPRNCCASQPRNFNVTWISRLLAPFDAYAVDCSLQFFAANPYHVDQAMLPPPSFHCRQFRPSDRADGFR